LQKAEVGIRDRTRTPTIQDFVESDFIPFIEARFQHKPNTLAYYRNGWRSLEAHAPLAGCTLDVVTADKVGTFIAKLRHDGLCVGSINRRLEVLRRLLRLATEWGKVQKVLPKVEMLPGEIHRDRVPSEEEETRYLEGATAIGTRFRRPINERCVASARRFAVRSQSNRRTLSYSETLPRCSSTAD
jgi:hypothetical protein